MKWRSNIENKEIIKILWLKLLLFPCKEPCHQLMMAKRNQRDSETCSTI